MHTHTHTHRHTHTPTHTDRDTDTDLQTHTHAHAHTRAHTHTPSGPADEIFADSVGGIENKEDAASPFIVKILAPLLYELGMGSSNCTQPLLTYSRVRAGVPMGARIQMPDRL